MLNITGEHYGRLTVIHESSRDGAHRYWAARCECGKTITVRQDSLRSGNTRSCGCLNVDVHTTHGVSKHPLFQVWKSIISRCRNKSDGSYCRYGEKGVEVCDRWAESFQFFLDDMGERPFIGAEIDRIDNGLGYTQKNCRWANGYQQAQNRGFFSSNKTGITGVCFLSLTGQWSAKIARNGKEKRKNFADFFEACCWRKSQESQFNRLGNLIISEAQNGY